ncbi:MlaA family lipoprotein [Erythrobacter sp. BLCC-B19]|uniref:MlaA family lipoprotein n=1 Tax=Erythrobacter sp. BLCC-B19 TaxID=3025315 RepID=UPI002361A1C1|nr:VacJ family lipoprotein [Erythrobacter sp. BLCC-B19]WDA42226.1 VacJ family lipoprotein [Erythrobacter sp. BLCC-B19]
MPTLALLAVSPGMLAAALPAAPAPLPVEWSLAAAEQANPPAEAPPAAPPPTDESAPAPEGDEPVSEIVVEGEYGPPKSDPMERVNEETYRITQAVDSAVIEPVAYAYRDGLPEPVRDGLGNVVRNLGEPSNALNFLLQGKVGKAFGSLGRFAINSTIGVGGLFDVAGKGAKIPYRRNGFANTLGFYGVGPGPYLYLPVTGATTVRDLVGSTLDQALLPFVVGKPFNRPEYAVTYFVVNGLDQRLDFDEELARIQSSDDPYLMRRETYLAKRRADIAQLKGEPISEMDQMRLDELKGEPEADAPAEAEPPADATPPEPPANPEAIAITQPR